MPQVTVKQLHRYGDALRRPGERYEAEERFLPLLTLTGWVELATAPVRVKRGASQRRRRGR